MMVSVTTLVCENDPSTFMNTSLLFKLMVKLSGLLMLFRTMLPSSLAVIVTICSLEKSSCEGEIVIASINKTSYEQPVKHG